MEGHINYLERAIKMAYDNVKEGGGGPFGALVVKEGEIIGEGVNQVTTINDPTAHAEISAIRNACKSLNDYQLDDCILYSSCEPCPMCLGAVYWARPSMIVFAASHNEAAEAGFDDSFIYRELSKPYDKRFVKTIQIKPGNYLRPFEKWINIDNKMKY